MARSVWKGPFVDGYLLKKAEKARASGSDSKIGSLMKIDLDVNLKEEGSGTLLSLVATVDILGKLATLGHSIMKRKANQVMAEFVRELKNHLEGES